MNFVKRYVCRTASLLLHYASCAHEQNRGKFLIISRRSPYHSRKSYEVRRTVFLPLLKIVRCPLPYISLLCTRKSCILYFYHFLQILQCSSQCSVTFSVNIVAAFRGMHAKHSYAWLPLESVTTGQTDRQTPDKAIPMCRYSSQATQKGWLQTVLFSSHCIHTCFARRGGAEVAGLWIGRSGFDSPLTLTACGPSDGKEVKDVFGRPGARVEVGSAR